MSDYSQSEKLARAVADDLNAAASEFAIGFIAKYDPLPECTLADLVTPRVNVRDLTQEMTGFASRSQSEHEYRVELICRVKLEQVNSLELSRLKVQAEQFINLFRFEKPTGCSQRLARIESVEVAPDNKLGEQGVGTITMQLVFVGWRS